MIFVHIWWWFQSITGTDNTAGRPYGFWSGWGSVFVLPIIITFGHYLVNRFTHVCHVDTCHKRGIYPIANGKYVVCKDHHPDHKGKDIKYVHILEAHKKSKGK